MSEHPDLDILARQVIDANTYMVLGTLDADGEPRLSPVYFTHVDYAEFYWISSPGSHHSQNVRRHPAVNTVIFDSRRAVGDGQCVYLHADAAVVPDVDLPEHCREAFSGDLHGGRAYGPEELSGEAPFRLYRAEATSYDVHVRGRHPVHGTGIDRRMPADPRDIDR